MKFTVNVDCTPDEARAFMGLPDVKPLQDEMMAALRDKMLDNLKMMEADKLMQLWGSLFNQGVALNQGMNTGLNQGMANLHEFFSKMMTGATTGMSGGVSSSGKSKK